MAVEPEFRYKQCIIIRNDVKMSCGKRCAQAGHASIGAYNNADKALAKAWISEGQKKVVLKADIRLEERAVKDYGAILQKVPFDDRSRVLVEKNLEDEKVHIKRWQDSLVILRTRRGKAS